MRLLVHVEGLTEEQFVQLVLMPHLVAHGFHYVAARRVGSGRAREKRRGIKPWASVKQEVVNHLRQDPGATATTMVDFYALPDSWPGREGRLVGSGVTHAQRIESNMECEIANEMGAGFDTRRFIPFLLVHEFEGLLFSDCAILSRVLNRPELEGQLSDVRDQFDTPEDINDSSDTAPSKRIERLIPRYQKPLFGNRAIQEIGLDRIRKQCPHFSGWLTRLEAIAVVSI